MKHGSTRLIAPLLFGLAALGLAPQTSTKPARAAPAKRHGTVGGGTVASPAVGLAPSFGIGRPGVVLVKNWHSGADGTVSRSRVQTARPCAGSPPTRC